jgi:replicative superfamily II helicase
MNYQFNSIQDLRNHYIKLIDSTRNKTDIIKKLAKDLYSLGLTVYSDEFSVKSAIYKSLTASFLDQNISLHPEQYKSLQLIEENKGIIFSAPTSFGKTFVIFEYIAKHKPNNIVLIVPTLALVDEYNKRIIKKYKDIFKSYKVHLSITPEDKFNFSEKNIFILTHDRIIEKSNYLAIEKVDFLVIDEVYKLKKDELNDRVLVLNLAYYHLVKIASKHVLLAPFIGGVNNIEKLDYSPIFHKTDFSPVVNEVITYNVFDENDRNLKALEILDEINDEKTLIYFPTVSKISKFVKKDMPINMVSNDEPNYNSFLKWIKEEIHEDWYLVKAMESGFLIHNAQLPAGIRLYQIFLYENTDTHNKLLCTSTLLEGINTSSKNIIITKPSRYGRGKDSLFDAFDFFNLVGRSGRLFEHFLGRAHYIKHKDDPNYIKNDAIKTIEFELTDESEDIDIYTDKHEKNEDYKLFLKELGITHEVYKENLGNKYRFKTIKKLYYDYRLNKNELLSTIDYLIENKNKSKLILIKKIHKIIEGNEHKIYCNIINKLLYKTRPSIRTIINELKEMFKKVDLDLLITNTLRIKSSYLEHNFYSKMLVIMFFMKCNNVSEKYFTYIDETIKSSMNMIYFTDSKHKRMLKDLGIYEKDIDQIVNIIGENFQDAFELKQLLINNKEKLNNISIISKFVIKSLIG